MDSAGPAVSTGTAGGVDAMASCDARGAPPPWAVIEWYRGHARDLPWRAPGTTPYGVLVSEVMSQQTPVARVVPAWRRWMDRWPDPAALAEAGTAEVLRMWGALGYPRRALRLIECARAVVERHGGRLPCDLEALRALPGIGEYTAGAVLAFAFGRRAPTCGACSLARSVAGPCPHRRWCGPSASGPRLFYPRPTTRRPPGRWRSWSWRHWCAPPASRVATTARGARSARGWQRARPRMSTPDGDADRRGGGRTARRGA